MTPMRTGDWPLSGMIGALISGADRECDVEHHVVIGERPPAVVIRQLLLQDRGGADRDALPGQAQAEAHDDERQPD